MQSIPMKTIQTHQPVMQLLTEHGIRPSYQRVRIYEYVQTMRNHPTVDMIYTALLPEIPTLSKTTIYNTLKLFVRQDIMQQIQIDEHEVRFDADTASHLHFRCIRCREITDHRFSGDDVPTAVRQLLPDGFAVQDAHFYLRGICSRCSG